MAHGADALDGVGDGLLYINLAAVMAGTIGAGALYVSTGLLI